MESNHHKRFCKPPPSQSDTRLFLEPETNIIKSTNLVVFIIESLHLTKDLDKLLCDTIPF